MLGLSGLGDREGCKTNQQKTANAYLMEAHLGDMEK
jgi:hypothetical protein